MQLHFYEPLLEQGKIVVSPPLSILEQGAKRWNCCLVGFILGNKLPFFFGKVKVYCYQKKNTREELKEDYSKHKRLQPKVRGKKGKPSNPLNYTQYTLLLENCFW